MHLKVPAIPPTAVTGRCSRTEPRKEGNMKQIVSPLPSPSSSKELSLRWPPRPIILEGIPLLYEDEEEGDMGEAELHTLTTGALFYGLKGLLKPWPKHE